MSEKTLTIEQVRGKDTAELRFDLQEAQKALFHDRFDLESEGKKSHSARALRRTIARILTVLTERERTEEANSQQ